MSVKTSIISFKALANLVTENDLANGSIYPPLEDIMNVSVKVATKIVEYAYVNGKYFLFNILNKCVFGFY